MERPTGYQAGMTTPCSPSDAGYRFPAEVISHAIWLYFRFPLSLRMVEEMLAARGIVGTHPVTAALCGRGILCGMRAQMQS